MTKIEAVIFDVGQVLHAYDPEPIYRDIIDTLGISEGDFKENWNRLTIQLELGTLTEEEYWRQFRIATGSLAQLPNESLLVRRYGVGFKIFDEVVNLARLLKERGIKIAVLSNSIKPHYEVNKRVGLYDHFPVQIFSYQVGLRKPDRRIYELALNSLQTFASSCLFIDDREQNVEAAKNLGIHGHLFVNTELLKVDLWDRFGIQISDQSE